MTVAGHMPPRPATPGPLTRARAFLVPLILVLSPVVGMVMVSARVLPAPGPSVARVMFCGFAFASVAYLIARRWREPVTASNMVALPLFMIGMYPAASTFAEKFTAITAGSVSSLLYLVFCLGTALVAARIPRESTRTLHDVLSIVAAILLTMSVWVLGGVYWWPTGYSPRTTAAIGHLSTPLQMPSSYKGAKPDVYHLVLDGMGRPDILADRYDLEVDEYLNELKSSGFEVSRQSHANYVQTHLSLSSMLNLEYLDELLEAQETSQNKSPLLDLIARARVPSAFKALGYEVEYMGSGFLTSGVFDTADHCDCPQLWFAEAEIGAISLTPFESLSDLGFGKRAYYERSLRVFDLFERSRVGTRPRYVFAHTAFPHPAFVVDETGRFTSPTGPPQRRRRIVFPRHA